MCLSCVGFQRDAIRDCTGYACPLWAYRPFQPGEDIEHAVRREVLEETNIKVGEVAYQSSQPWPFPHSLMIGCLGRAETTDITIDSGELADARWFSRKDARLMLEKRHPEGFHVPGRQAIAHTLIERFLEES